MSQLVLNILIYSAIYSLISYSFHLIYRSSKVFHIAHASFISLGAYFFYFFNVQLSVPLLLSTALATIATSILIVPIYYGIYKPLLDQNSNNWKILIVSIGTHVVVSNIIPLIWGSQTLSFRKWQIQEGYKILDMYITEVQIIIIIVAGIILTLLVSVMALTKFGKQFRAVSSNPELSLILGVSKEKTIIKSFVLGTGIAAISGILLSAEIDIYPNLGFDWFIFALVAMIISGLGKIGSIVLGAILLSTFQNLGAYYLDGKWMEAAAYVCLIAFLFWKPYGISGIKLKKVEI